MKKKMLATNSRLLKSPNTQLTTLGSIRLGGGEIRYDPHRTACAASSSRPPSVGGTGEVPAFNDDFRLSPCLV